MTANPSVNPNGDDRRRNVRLASESTMKAAVIDDQHRPVKTLQESAVINVSADGMAFLTTTAVETGWRLVAYVGGDIETDQPESELELEILESVPQKNDQYLIRCRLLSGKIPATLVFHW